MIKRLKTWLDTTLLKSPLSVGSRHTAGHSSEDLHRHLMVRDRYLWDGYLTGSVQCTCPCGCAALGKREICVSCSVAGWK